MISPQHVKPNGMVPLWDEVLGAHVQMWPVDASHAIEVEPERYFLEKPEVAADEPTKEPVGKRDASELGGETAK